MISVMTQICQIGTIDASPFVPDRPWRRHSGQRIPPLMAKHFLKEWRKFREMTLEQAEEASGLSHSVITRLENDRRDYSAHHLIALAKAYRCSEPDLLGRNPLAHPPGGDGVSSRIHELVTALPKDTQKTVLQMIEALRKG